MQNEISRTLAALTIGLAGGAIFYYLNLPLPWMLGSFALTLIIAIPFGYIDVDRKLRKLAMPVLGVLIGCSFKPEIIQEIHNWPIGICLVLFYTVFTTFVGYKYLTKIAKWDKVTALFSSPPGGLAELVFIGADSGADERRMILTHSIRIAMVVTISTVLLRFYFNIEFTTIGISNPPDMIVSIIDWIILFSCAVVGMFLGLKFKLPGGALFGALLLSGFVHITSITEANLPLWIVASAQIVIGSSLGVRFNGITRSELKNTVKHAFVMGSLMISIALLIAIIMGPIINFDSRALFLAMAPGGFTEMLLLAIAIGIESAFIATSHSVRIIVIFLCVPLSSYLLKKIK
jgi:membrane AbrB-like protein